MSETFEASWRDGLTPDEAAQLVEHITDDVTKAPTATLDHVKDAWAAAGELGLDIEFYANE